MSEIEPGTRVIILYPFVQGGSQSFLNGAHGEVVTRRSGSENDYLVYLDPPVRGYSDSLEYRYVVEDARHLELARQ